MDRKPLALALLLTSALACSAGPAAEDATGPESVAPAQQPEALTRITAGPHPIATLDLGDLGTIRIELLPELAPATVANFQKLAAEAFYDGTSFHRVIPGFMIQGGDPNSRNPDPRDHGRGGPSQTIPDEFTDYPHTRGTVSMANRGSEDSAGSQFFIVHADSRRLDGQYTAFGRVLEGNEVMDAITELEIDRFGRYGPPNRPYPVSAVLKSVRVASPAQAVVRAPEPRPRYPTAER